MGKIKDKYHLLQDRSKTEFIIMLEEFENDGYKPLWDSYEHNIVYNERSSEMENHYSIVLEKVNLESSDSKEEPKNNKDKKSWGLLGK